MTLPQEHPALLWTIPCVTDPPSAHRLTPSDSSSRQISLAVFLQGNLGSAKPRGFGTSQSEWVEDAVRMWSPAFDSLVPAQSYPLWHICSVFRFTFPRACRDVWRHFGGGCSPEKAQPATKHHAAARSFLPAPSGTGRRIGKKKVKLVG